MLQTSAQRVVLFGGSFDPIHNGHLGVAQFAKQALRAQQLIFVPARQSPHKHQPPLASETQRLAMIQLAISDLEGFEVSDCEFYRLQPSYSVDTVRYFRRRLGEQSELFWLVGADNVAGFAQWHQVDQFVRLCRVCFMVRGGCPAPDLDQLAPYFDRQTIEQMKEDMLETPRIDISSTDIRQRIAAGLPIDGLVPPAVAAYIERHGLYKPSPAGGKT